MSEFISKPFTQDRILVLVERLLKEAKISEEKDSLKQENQLIHRRLEIASESKLRLAAELAPIRSRLLTTAEHLHYDFQLGMLDEVFYCSLFGVANTLVPTSPRKEA